MELLEENHETNTLPDFRRNAPLPCDSANIFAQATAQIAGTVKDQSGAVLPGVEVHVTQTDTGVTRDAVTNETGSYVLSNLPIGPYRLEAALPGFRTYAQTGIVLQVNSSPAINAVLEVGQVTEQVEVQANATLVETRNAGVGQVVENARILELPLNGRQVIELIALAGAASPAPTVTGGGRDPFAKGSVSVAGGMNSGLNYTLDGANHDNQFDNGYLSMPFPDALQEFKVQTSASGAQTGVKSAGSVSLVTKSGTNEFHGNLFEFVRNGIFNARNAFALKRDTIKRNQYGGTVGGPIMKNKLFFFAGYQGTKIRQDPSDNITFVPTAAMLAGDWTDIRFPCLQRRPADCVESSICEQPHRSCAIQQTGRGFREQTTAAQPIRAAKSYIATRALRTITWRSAESTTSGAPIIRCSAGI